LSFITTVFLVDEAGTTKSVGVTLRLVNGRSIATLDGMLCAFCTIIRIVFSRLFLIGVVVFHLLNDLQI
jgi:hypothetical protein